MEKMRKIHNRFLSLPLLYKKTRLYYPKKYIQTLYIYCVYFCNGIYLHS